MCTLWVLKPDFLIALLRRSPQPKGKENVTHEDKSKSPGRIGPLLPTSLILKVTAQAVAMTLPSLPTYCPVFPPRTNLGQPHRRQHQEEDKQWLIWVPQATSPFPSKGPTPHSLSRKIPLGRDIDPSWLDGTLYLFMSPQPPKAGICMGLARPQRPGD